MTDIRVIVGLDFGTTYSGFTYCHADEEDSDEKYTTNEEWPDDRGTQFKTNTVLQYYENKVDVKSWGYPALAKRPNQKFDRNQQDCVVELFKLQLGNLNKDLKKKYELSVNYKKAITDYLRKMGKLIKDTVKNKWKEIEFFKNVLLVLTVPAEYTEGAKAIMRECAHNAELIDDIASRKLQITTEPEAAAIYCMDKCLKEYDLDTIGTTFMIVDCGGGTVDLTTVKLLNENQLAEVTERAGDYCGSAFIDAEFIKYLRGKLGDKAIDLLRDNYYGQMQYMVQEFCQQVKLPFTGDDTTFVYEIDLEKVSPVLLQHVTDDVRKKMEGAEWLIKLDYETIKSMFNQVINRIIRMIHVQLENCQEETCSAMFLVGGFSQSGYLQKKIIQEFADHKVYVPSNPIAAISHGAAIYGLSFRKNRKNVDDDMDDDVNDDDDDLMFVIDSRVLKFTYGIKVFSPWKDGDPEDRKNELFRFHTIGTTRKAKRGTRVKTNEEFTVSTRPTLPSQTRGEFEVFYTRKYKANYCDKDKDEMNLLGKLIIDWPDVHLGLDRPTTFKLAFGKTEFTAMAKNEKNGQNYQTSFKIDPEEA